MILIPEHQRNWLDDLDAAMRREIRLQRSACEEIWNTDLPTRMELGHSLGHLRIASTSSDHLILRPANTSAELANFSRREGDFVRLSRNCPHQPVGRFIFLDEDDSGIHLLRWKGAMPSGNHQDWVIDPDFYDMSERLAQAIEALATTELGRNRILPLLMGEENSSLDTDLFDQTMDDLDAPGPQDPSWHDSQKDAIAACVAAHSAHLVQGPPGTGKTIVLSEIASRLIHRGERVLVTGPTHRAINHALAAIRNTVPATTRVVKIGFLPTSPAPYETFEDYLSSGLMDSDDPHVIGATPYALWSKFTHLRQARFDTVLHDEASQLTPLQAALAMLRGERWLFFGDDCQLPPVVLADDTTPPRERSVFGRLKNRGMDTLLEETWRLNQPLAEWPSATFYHNRLSCRHDRRLVLSPAPEHPALAPNPSACLIPCPSPNRSTVRSDEEAQIAVDLVRAAVRGGSDPERIGVITPFRAHAARIRQILGMAEQAGNLRKRVTVDTVERYQGQERDMIIVTLASNDVDFIHARADFLFQPERWNVAMTRAKLKTIVIASPALINAALSLAEAGHQGASCFSSLVDHLQHHAR